MSFGFFKKSKAVESTEFSTFVREARSGDKKKVFKRVLTDSIDAQDRVFKDVEKRRAKNVG
jgi:hypothetical protein